MCWLFQNIIHFPHPLIMSKDKDTQEAATLTCHMRRRVLLLCHNLTPCRQFATPSLPSTNIQYMDSNSSNILLLWFFKTCWTMRRTSHIALWKTVGRPQVEAVAAASLGACRLAHSKCIVGMLSQRSTQLKQHRVSPH